MSATNAIETEYVSQKIFDLQLDNIKYRAETDRERVDNRLEKNQAVIYKNMAEVKNMFSELRNEMKNVRNELRSEINNINGELRNEIKSVRNELRSEINNVRNELKSDIKLLDAKIEATNERFDDLKESQNKWFTVFGILFTAAAIISPVAVAVVQHFMTK